MPNDLTARLVEALKEARRTIGYWSKPETETDLLNRIDALLAEAAQASAKPEAWKCSRCGASTSEACHERLCGFVDAAPPAAPEGFVLVPESALRWLFGEEGEFECPPERYFRGKPPAYWWRSEFRRRIAAAPTPGE